MIRVFVADNHVLVRRGLRELCREMDGYIVTGMVANGDDALEALGRDRFDLILLDLVPGMARRELIGAIRDTTAQTPILVFSQPDDPHVVKRLLQAGAAGFVSKKSCTDILMLAMRKVASGGRFVDSSIGGDVLLEYFCVSPPDTCLSPRELQIMTLLAQGQNVTTIATALAISDKTVSTHKVRLMHKLHLRNDAELVRCALDYGLVG
ncbi:response regulator [Paludibacterium yongneupense]|uniref:response regulator n=1 Tax=Paludibacterium yongneupense TaxID=400061 RepID=UPI0004914D4C|nr:response regulator transcription factor [Paludibacterium yongneupense]